MTTTEIKTTVAAIQSILVNKIGDTADLVKKESVIEKLLPKELKGSDKQVAWAKSIIAALSWEGVNENDIANVAKSYILDIDQATWWIDNRNLSGYDMIYAAFTGGLMVPREHLNNSRTILKISSAGCTLSWERLVHDGRGGHKLTESRSL
jgi:hypothetical protein